jgi:cytochrome P450
VEAIKNELDGYLTKIIVKRKKEMLNPGHQKRPDILTLAISASEEQGESLALESILSHQCSR